MKSMDSKFILKGKPALDRARPVLLEDVINGNTVCKLSNDIFMLLRLSS